MRQYDKTRLALKCLNWDDYKFLVTERGLQRARLHRGHHRRPWQLDCYVVKYFCPFESLNELSSWQAKAQSREDCQRYQDRWCMYRLTFRLVGFALLCLMATYVLLNIYRGCGMTAAQVYIVVPGSRF